MTIVVDGWEVAVTRFEKRVGPFTIDIRTQAGDGVRWSVEATTIQGFDQAGGFCPNVDEAKAMAERVAGLLGGLVGGP